ncbi:hypothetical protein [Dermabacter vaginalis]|uniref:hypothetical protein n=1 Tax=Dermabacter vaginalis TaxID=1630135 RepID=UPI001EF47DB7|nr:hypothetical protein [Dermabacter vaginalis]MCG7443802.1 hypothetical protein [Dermabacter vaginalis]
MSAASTSSSHAASWAGPIAGILRILVGVVVLLLFAVNASDHLGFGRATTKLVGEKSILR